MVLIYLRLVYLVFINTYNFLSLSPIAAIQQTKL